MTKVHKEYSKSYFITNIYANDGIQKK